MEAKRSGRSHNFNWITQRNSVTIVWLLRINVYRQDTWEKNILWISLPLSAFTPRKIAECSLSLDIVHFVSWLTNADKWSKEADMARNERAFIQYVDDQLNWKDVFAVWTVFQFTFSFLGSILQFFIEYFSLIRIYQFHGQSALGNKQFIFGFYEMKFWFNIFCFLFFVNRKWCPIHLSYYK